MPVVQWMIKGPQIATCNCDWGCPCQFNALPTHGNCRVAVAVRVDEGRFADVDLAGAKWVACLAWPGPIHEGHGEVFTIVDEATSPAQRDAIFTILKGEETEPGATIFNVFSSVIEKMHEPVFRPIDFEVDIEARQGRFKVADLVESQVEPIRNPVTGAEHRIRVTIPQGFEYHEAEYASSATKAKGPISLDWTRGHCHLNVLHMTGSGPVH
ncbi:MAG: DUF1326 domain-containing protein [Parvibaculaceae bacterium]